MSDKPTVLIFMSVLCTGLVYFAIGLPLAVLPGWVHGDLGYTAAVAGSAISIQYIATIASRGLVGLIADTSGPRRSISIGFACTVVSGSMLLFASRATESSSLPLAMLFISRIALGFGEALVATAAVTWAISRTTPAHITRIISWNGIATYAAIAAGAPSGVFLFHIAGIGAIGMALVVTGIVGFVFTLAQSATVPIPEARLPFSTVFMRVLPYGAALAFGAIGFGVISAFIALYYADHHWTGAWIALSGFGCAFVLSRLLFVGSVTRHGGLKVAAAFLTIEAVGLMTVWLAVIPAFAILGAAAAGFGFAMLFPALGVIVVDLAPPQNRSAAIGAYSMFTDVALFATGPSAGVLASRAGYPAPFLFATVASLFGLVTVLALMWSRRSYSRRCSEESECPASRGGYI